MPNSTLETIEKSFNCSLILRGPSSPEIHKIQSSTTYLVRYRLSISYQSALPACLFKMHARSYESHVSVGLWKIPQRFASFWIDLFRIQSQMVATLGQLVQEPLGLP